MKRFLPLFFLLLLVRGPAGGQDVDVDNLLRWTSTVGEMLYSYNVAFERALIVVSSYADEEIPKLYGAGPHGDGAWSFSFGAFEDDATFVITYGIVITSEGDVARFEHFEERREASPHHTAAARALRNVHQDFQELRATDDFSADRYHIAVLPFPRTKLTAFVYPAQTRPGVTLMGNDVMYAIDRASGEVEDRRRYQHSLMPMPTNIPSDATAAVSIQPTPLPSPVHVMHAMEREARLAVLARLGVFLVRADSSIEMLPDDDPLAESLRGQWGTGQ